MIYQIILNDIPNGSVTSDSEDIQPNGGIKDGMSYQGNTTDVVYPHLKSKSFHV